MRAYSLEVGAPPEARLPPPTDQAKSAPKRRSSSFAPLGAAVAALLVLVAASGWYLLGGGTNETCAGRASFDRRPALHQPLWRSCSPPPPPPPPPPPRATPPLPTKAKASTPKRSARSLAFATCWKVQSSAIENQVRVNAQLIDAHDRRASVGRAFRQTSCRPFQYARRDRRQPRQSIGRRAGHQRGAPRGTGARSRIRWISIFKGWRGLTREEIPTISPARAVSSNALWRSILAISTRRSAWRRRIFRSP